MLEVSFLIDGIAAKELNTFCEDYMKFKPTYDDLKKVCDKNSTAIKKILKAESEEGGTYETTKYICKMSKSKGYPKVDLKEIEEKAPEIFKKLAELDLIHFTNETFRLDKVIEKK